ncbi:response regulator transcription factor [Bordetella bronchiseptica]|uniref:N-acetyltransferase YedL n=2 Tax=Bordetella bronchiseptica TaxID=518 RepID=A0ABR4R960_BORBO|nr:response regulator transcription factor [Bordetella bronchiseptica]SHQ16393.1 Uncharacterised protein [Mycobacteroides abscessus subsp. abscessus]AWP73217.1 transcriptional regulator [Bordetella bronchiseptica]AZW10758.1 DNA-binding response regulator [Bordetella bronchiseptica]AZW20018.1 DNA-binding response regulator [Bordetella bronchiseptica]KCV31279.1 hypothetical protein L490_0041 [Bordetella bronchiseptica 00-P-2796]
MSTYSIPDDSCAGRILLAFSSVMIEARVQLEAGWRQAGWTVDWCEGQHALARLLAMHPPDAVALCGVAGTLSGLVRTTRTSVPAAVVVALLSEGGLPERIAMMRAGVDLCWPIETQVEEVAAMVDAFARRGTASAAAASAWYLSNAGRVLAGPGGVRLPLTVAEREFMARLLAAPGHRLARQQLACGFRQRGTQDGAPVSSEALPSWTANASHAASYDAAASLSRNVDVMVSRLRAKAQRMGINLPLLSVRRWGYLFIADSDAG